MIFGYAGELRERLSGINRLGTHIAQNIAERCQKYFLYFIAIEILSQHFCQILQNISSQQYNFNFMKYFLKLINI